MDQNEYLELLEQSVKMQTRYKSPADKIIQWDGKGELSEEVDDKSLNDIVAKTIKDKLQTTKTGKEAGVVKETRYSTSPLDMLESEPFNGNDLYKSITETDANEIEERMIGKLINEMDQLDIELTNELEEEDMYDIPEVDEIPFEEIDGDTSLDDIENELMEDDMENDIYSEYDELGELEDIETELDEY